MSAVHGFSRRPGVRFVMRVLLSIWVAALVASPLLLHDAACHVKTRTDCTACTLDLASGDVRAHTAPGTTRLTPQIGQLPLSHDRLPVSLLVVSTADRAPPA